MDIQSQNLQGYEIIERIDAGGFGAVYRARQSTVNREVAVKFILPGRANQPDFIRRFEAEAQIIARLEHPHITPLIDYWRDPNGAYLVMRYLKGGSLRGGLQDGPFELNHISLLLDQISSALEFAHRQDVIHRDIKPANILLDEDGNAYLADFGIAKDLQIGDQNTEPDAIVGSLDYISPEQARSEPVTSRTDIYSLGVMLYELITGEHPFKNVSSVERLYKHINDPLPIIDNLPENVRDSINDIIQKATAKDPANRFSDVIALAVAFRDGIGRGTTTQEVKVIEQLTMREHEILQLIADSLSNREIAEKLFITVSTVRWNIRNIYKKLGVKSRVQAIVRAREMDLIGTPDVSKDTQAQSIAVASQMIEPDNPYKGLQAFQSADAPDFFGREQLIKKLIKKLDTEKDNHRFLSIVGPSGSGKSSLVHAGLVPAIWKGDIEGSEKWFVIDMLPGTHPLEALEVALLRIAGDQAGNINEQLQRDERGLLRIANLILPKDNSELLLVIDQFEEVFTLVDNEQARQHFLNIIRTTVSDNRSRVRVIVTLRADYYDRPLHYAKFGSMFRQQMETIMPISAKGLERAIRGPAERVGVTFEAGLVEEIVSQMTYQSGVLPLLQYALTELFDRREELLLTHQAYQDIGGAVGALANRADELYLEYDEQGRELIRQMFLRLVTIGEGTEDTRRRALRSELLELSQDSDLIDEIIDTFVVHRLLSTDHSAHTRQPTVEVAHEAILREWERLRFWLNDSRLDISMQQQLSSLANEWQTAQHDNSFLLRGTRLEMFENWLTGTDIVLTSLEQTYIQNSIALRVEESHLEEQQRQHQVELEQRARRFLQGLVGVFLIAAVISIMLAISATNQQQIAEVERVNAQQSANESLSTALSSRAREAFENNDHNLALTLAIESVNVVDEPSFEVQRTLTDIAYAPGLRHVLDSESAIPHGSAFHPDGKRVVIARGGADVFFGEVSTDLDHVRSRYWRSNSTICRTSQYYIWRCISPRWSDCGCRWCRGNDSLECRNG